MPVKKKKQKKNVRKQPVKKVKRIKRTPEKKENTTPVVVNPKPEEVSLQKKEALRMGLIPLDVNSPSQVLKLASLLQKHVKDNNLTVKIQKTDYVRVEGWQYAGSQIGVIPIITHVKNLSTGEPKQFEVSVYKWEHGKRVYKGKKTITVPHMKYEATCELRRMSDDKMLSRGFAICSNMENGKHEHEEFAIMSHAQTRSQGKAFRLLLGWLMQSAGFPTTPAEEMDEVQFNETESQNIQQGSEPPPTHKDVPEEITKQIETFTELDDLMTFANDQTGLHKNLTFRSVVQTKKTELMLKSINETTSMIQLQEFNKRHPSQLKVITDAITLKALQFSNQ